MHAQSSNKESDICHSSIKLCNEKRRRLPSGYCTDHTDRPRLCDACWGRVEMTHSTATYTAVDDYDNSRTALHKQLCGATLIIPDSLSLTSFTPHSPIILFLFLSDTPLSLSRSPRLRVFLSFPVLANHTQKGCCCWILIFIYTASLWCPPSPPQCSVSTSLSRVLPALPASPEYLPQHPVLWVCVCTDCRYYPRSPNNAAIYEGIVRANWGDAWRVKVAREWSIKQRWLLYKS